MSEERVALISHLQRARNLVDALTALLTACRANEENLARITQRREERTRQAKIIEEVNEHITSVYFRQSSKDYICGKLSCEDWIFVTRAIAVALDLKIRKLDPRKYSVMCYAGGVRELQDLDPYPTPAAALESMYGKGEFSMHPRDGVGLSAVDRVSGLALWNAAQHHYINVIYDPVSGAALDSSLDGGVEILTVTPNQNYAAEFSPGESTASGFFGVTVLDESQQNNVLRQSIDFCSENHIDILVLPELTATEDSDRIIEDLLARPETDVRGGPSIVIAGSRHVQSVDKRVNRMSITYRRPHHRVHHDKIGRFVNGPFEVLNDHGLAPNYGNEEDIDRSTTLRLHAGIDWSMIPLICADFQHENVVKTVSDLHPRLVIVSAMSPKTTQFEDMAGHVIASCQATVVVANGPAEWQPPESAGTVRLGAEDRLPERAASIKLAAESVKPAGADRVQQSGSTTIALFVLPLADPAVRVQRIVPPPYAVAPHRVWFRSLERSAELI